MPDASDPAFEISLAQWSLHRTLQGGALDNLDFARHARETFDIRAVEYVNQFFKDKATDFVYLAQMRDRAAEVEVKSLLIMIDGEGQLGHADDAQREQAITNHFKWIAAASFLGCHAIRVNAGGVGFDEAQKGIERTAASLRKLGEMGDDYGIDVIVENHGGLSSDGSWLASVMQAADHRRVGTLPDFGNFWLRDDQWYDRYQGMEELMPYAKAVSAKSHEFDEDGNEVRSDFRRMMKIVLDAGYSGHVGIEYEGGQLSEEDGIRATKRLLEKVRAELAER